MQKNTIVIKFMIFWQTKYKISKSKEKWLVIVKASKVINLKKKIQKNKKKEILFLLNQLKQLIDYIELMRLVILRN